MPNQQNKQKILWENIYLQYKNHYFDYWSTKFKNRFIFNKILKLNLFTAKKNVAELCCGSGENSYFFHQKFSGISITGFDISKAAVEDFKFNLNSKAYEVDIQKSINGFDKKFDVIFVLGGLHHCTKNLQGVLKNVSKMLKPGGAFLMHEPNNKFFLEPIRKYWYKKDPLFDNENEDALSHDDLTKIGRKFGFNCVYLEYTGGPGYFFILQSMIFRMPKLIKFLFSPLFFAIEILWDLQSIKSLNNTFIAVWKLK